MTNYYSLPNNGAEYQMYSQSGYPTDYQMYYPQQRSVLPAVLAASTLGFVGGAGITAGVHYFKNRRPVSSSGEVSDSFAKQVLDKMVNKNYVSKGKEFFKQKFEVLKKLGKISKPEEFTKLMNKNKTFCKSLCDGISLDTMCKTVTKENIKSKISALKSRIESSMRNELQNVKDTIKLCWDRENKKFVKPNCIEEKIYKLIKNTKSEFPWKKACKYGGITAGILGALTLGLAVASNKTRQ